MNDQTIIELLKSDKHGKAFVALYSHYPKVEKLIKRNGGSKDDSKDVYQEALIILYKKVTEGNFTLTSSLGTYLYSVCRYLWMDQQRKQGKVFTETFTEENEDIAFEEMSKGAEQEAKLQLAEKALASLGEKCKEILMLFYVRKSPMSEIAKLLGYSSENTAKNQKYKCLESARKAFGNSLEL